MPYIWLARTSKEVRRRAKVASRPAREADKSFFIDLIIKLNNNENGKLNVEKCNRHAKLKTVSPPGNWHKIHLGQILLRIYNLLIRIYNINLTLLK